MSCQCEPAEVAATVVVLDVLDAVVVRCLVVVNFEEVVDLVDVVVSFVEVALTVAAELCAG